MPGASLSAADDDSSGTAAANSADPGAAGGGDGLQSLAGNTQGPDSIGKKFELEF